MTDVAMNAKDRKRLEALAQKCGRTPDSMLPFVLKDGFAACEEDVDFVLQSIEEMDAGQSVSHEEFLRLTRKTLDDAKQKKAA